MRILSDFIIWLFASRKLLHNFICTYMSYRINCKRNFSGKETFDIFSEISELLRTRKKKENKISISPSVVNRLGILRGIASLSRGRTCHGPELGKERSVADRNALSRRLRRHAVCHAALGCLATHCHAIKRAADSCSRRIAHANVSTRFLANRRKSFRNSLRRYSFIAKKEKKDRRVWNFNNFE